jgi:hypothetical protein
MGEGAGLFIEWGEIDSIIGSKENNFINLRTLAQKKQVVWRTFYLLFYSIC